MEGATVAYIGKKAYFRLSSMHKHGVKKKVMSENEYMLAPQPTPV